MRRCEHGRIVKGLELHHGLPKARIKASFLEAMVRFVY